MDFNDVTWSYIEKWAQEKLDYERARNDDAKLDPTATAAVRGRISILKELLALPIQKKAAQAQQG